ncbi:asparagine synthase C-terminal domain-containing protein [Paucibacter sp. APW11]|uniref:asparagine synthase (glutamine-hydrolyzing) n=1 Tax=Roseateles aquae TaxID=3077235 RepID=A0ABU3P5S6_9BURK|nr:asparagine synthase C-terminal domain-containing protein [Paucibacter sp. APW11]MDT8997934.1 asparagine synthase C-terminal domain-containing protein [Paucibacter sp. APW11]
MNQESKTLVCGTPRFGSTALQQAAAGNALAAWQQLAAAPDALQQLLAVRGNFSVGLRDASGAAFLAVDRFANFSLCYRVRDGQIDFALRADDLADERDEIDPQAIYDYLYFHCIPSPRTIYKSIFRLPPGHCLIGQGSEFRVQRYWTPSFQEPRGGNFEQLAAEFRAIVKQSVADQLDGSKPACFLSGGTDSSTVAGMMREVTGAAPQSYSIGFEAQGYDEMEYARLAARRFGCDHHEYYVTPQDIVDGLPMVAAHYDQPFGNSSALPAYYCARFAQQDGVSKLLAGDGGDELFGGNSRYATQRIFGWYDHVPRALGRYLLEPILATGVAKAFPLTRKAGSYVEQARVPMPERLQMYNLLLRLGPDALFTPELLRQVDRGAPAAHQQQTWRECEAGSELNRTLAFDWRYTLSESDLPKVVGTTGLAGVQVGFPLLSDSLLDFSMQLPLDYKLRGLKLRWFFKEALRGFLPDEIITKKKHGFGLPFGVWLASNADLGALARDSLYGLVERGILRRDFVTQLLEQRLREHPGYYGEAVWILTVLELWLKAKKPGFKL